MKKSIMLFVFFLSSYALAQSGWQLQTNPLGYGEEAMIGKIQFISPTEGWISGSRGTFLHTTDAGANWIIVDPFPEDSVWSPSDAAWSMSWVNQNYGWKINTIGSVFGNAYGVVIHQTTNGGISWSKKVLSTDFGDNGAKIQFVDQNNGWVLIYNFTNGTAKFLHTIDGGNNWSPFTGAGIFFFVDPNNGWSFYGSGTNGSTPPYVILRTTDGGTTWAEQFRDTTTGGYNEMQFSDINNGWIVGDNGKVIKTTDGGAHWNFVTNSGINPLQRSKTVFFLDANNGWIPSKTSGQEEAYIQHTTDGGATWSTQTTPLGNQGGNAIFSLFFVDAQNGWLTSDWGRICKYTSINAVDDNSTAPGEFVMFQNYPNPFNPATKISWQSPVSSWQSLRVYDVLGNELATLVDEFKPAGSYEVEFNASHLPSGVYFYKLSAGNFSDVKKLILLK